MRHSLGHTIEEAKEAAVQVLLHNLKGAYHGLPRTAGWGYPEPYTRDLMISSLGILVTDNAQLVDGVRRVLEALAQHQTSRGLIPSLADNPNDLGASDTTPLFLIGLALYRQTTGDSNFLEEAAQKALTWMEYQSPDDRVMVGQLPTSDWRDEHWVLGYGLYVNALAYTYLRLYDRHEQASELRHLMNRFNVRMRNGKRCMHEGLAIAHQPYYALWAYKIYKNERFDLLGNSIAILSGITSPSRARRLVAWIEGSCDALKLDDQLAVDLPPCLFPYMQPEDIDWRERYDRFGPAGDYHNGGVWPFICGFYVAALVAAGRQSLAERKLTALTRLVRPAREAPVAYGFNEWLRAQDGTPQGQDWQTWSAAMYLYAVACVERRETPFFAPLRNGPLSVPNDLSSQ